MDKTDARIARLEAKLKRYEELFRIQRRTGKVSMAKAKKKAAAPKKRAVRATVWKPTTGITDPHNRDLKNEAHHGYTYYRIHPKRPGIYQVANLASYSYGYAYAKWDGVKWRPFGQWGSNGAEKGEPILWRGKGAKRQLPFTEKEVAA